MLIKYTIPLLWRHGSFGRALIASIIREWIMPYVSWLFGATGFNRQILPYVILFLTFIITNVLYLLSFKFSR
jgi:hypothetical protein